jgi:DNA-binding response OmpR family regulator
MKMSLPLALIVEDEVDLADIFSAALKAAGFATETITDGEVALSRLRTVEPQIVVLDLHLPSVNGLQILEYIRGNQGLEDTHIIIVSADAALAQNLEADLVLLKPISFGQLRDLTKRILKSLDTANG